MALRHYRVTRDSAVLWIAAALSVVLYLKADGRPPSSWSYDDWLKAVAGALIWTSGKLATSPLPSKREARAARRHR
jgi:hypothetical protein